MAAINIFKSKFENSDEAKLIIERISRTTILLAVFWGALALYINVRESLIHAILLITAASLLHIRKTTKYAVAVAMALLMGIAAAGSAYICLHYYKLTVTLTVSLIFFGAAIQTVRATIYLKKRAQIPPPPAGATTKDRLAS